MTKNVNVILHTCALPPLSPYVLHYGPMDASKNGEPVFNYRYGLPGEDWRGAEPNDPLSVVDQVGTKYFIGKNSAEVGEFDKKGLVQYCINWHQSLPCLRLNTFMFTLVSSLFTQVELALAYGCTANLSTDFIIDYIHSNRKSNALRIDTLGSKISSIQNKKNKLDVVQLCETLMIMLSH